MHSFVKDQTIPNASIHCVTVLTENGLNGLYQVSGAYSGRQIEPQLSNVIHCWNQIFHDDFPPAANLALLSEGFITLIEILCSKTDNRIGNKSA